MGFLTSVRTRAAILLVAIFIYSVLYFDELVGSTIERWAAYVGGALLFICTDHVISRLAGIRSFIDISIIYHIDRLNFEKHNDRDKENVYFISKLLGISSLICKSLILTIPASFFTKLSDQIGSIYFIFAYILFIVATVILYITICFIFREKPRIATIISEKIWKRD